MNPKEVSFAGQMYAREYAPTIKQAAWLKKLLNTYCGITMAEINPEAGIGAL